MASKYDKVGKSFPGVYFYTSKVKRHLGKPDICYVITYRVDGKQRWETVGWKSEKISPQIACEMRSDRTKKARLGDEVLTTKEAKAKKRTENRSLDFVAKAYFENRDGSAKGKKIDQGRYDNHVAPVLGKKAIQLITELDLKRIERKMVGLSKASIWGALELVRRISNYGVRNGLCHPLKFTVKLPKRDNEVVRYLQPNQLKKLNTVLDSWEARDVVRMLRLVMLTGMRRGEIFKLIDSDLDFHQHLILLRDPKGGTTLSIPMGDNVSRLFKRQMRWRDEMYPGSSFIFPGQEGKMRQTSTAAGRIKKATGLPKEWRMFHDLRHHYAVMLANSGEVSIEEISELLTHKDINLTRKRYAQFLPERMKAAADKAARIMGVA